MVAELRDLDDEAKAEAMRLWDIKALLTSYENLFRDLNASTRRVHQLPLARAAGETLVLGRDVLRHIYLDPLLPEELIPQEPLHKMIRTMITYDEMARQIWRRFMHQFDSK